MPYAVCNSCKQVIAAQEVTSARQELSTNTIEAVHGSAAGWHTYTRVRLCAQQVRQESWLTRQRAASCQLYSTTAAAANPPLGGRFDKHVRAA